MLSWSGRGEVASGMACLLSDSGTVCLVSCVSFSFLSLTAYPVTQHDMLIVNTWFLSIFYEKLSKPSKMYVKKAFQCPGLVMGLT